MPAGFTEQRGQQQGHLPAGRRAGVQHLHGHRDRAREGDPRLLRRADEHPHLGCRLRRAGQCPAPGVHQPDRHERNRRRRLHPGQQRGPGDRDGHRGRDRPRHPDRQRPGPHRQPEHRPGRSASPAQFGVPPNIAKPAAGASFQRSIDQASSWAPCSGAGRSHTPPRAARGRQLHVPGPRQHRANTIRPRPRGLHRLHRRHGAGHETDGQDPAFAGETLTYTITARNNGAGTAENARVVDVLPPGRATTRARSRAPTHPGR